MPARRPAAIGNDPDPIAALGDLLVGMTPAQLRTFVMGLEDDRDVDLVERVLAERTAVGWRANPATMAHRLTGGDYKLWPYVVLLAEKAAAAFRGEDPHQIWNMPSQYGKTSLLRWTIVWALDRDPTCRLMYVSYDADKAVEEGGGARDLAELHAEHLRFRLRTDVRARGRWMTEQGGGLYCVGVNGAITGFPADALLLDDLVKGWQDAHSEARRAHVWNVYTSQIRMRIQSRTQPILVAGTRWHEDDPTGRLVDAGEDNPVADQFTRVRLPAIAEAPDPSNPDPMLREPDPLGREPGQVLEPDRFPEQEVMARQAALGSYLHAALEQQRPAPEEGGEIQRAWWRWVDAPPPVADDWCSSWDMKLKDKEAGDFVVGQVWARTGSVFTMCTQYRGQWSQAMTRVAIALCHVRAPQVQRHYIENTGNGPEVMEQLRNPAPDYRLDDDVASKVGVTEAERPLVERVMHRGLPGLLPVTVKGQKPVRLRAVSPLIEAGNVQLVRGPSADALVNEAAAFPNGTHDDMVDALSQALSKMSKGTASTSTPKRRGSTARPTSARRTTPRRRT